MLSCRCYAPADLRVHRTANPSVRLGWCSMCVRCLVLWHCTYCLSGLYVTYGGCHRTVWYLYRTDWREIARFICNCHPQTAPQALQSVDIFMDTFSHLIALGEGAIGAGLQTPPSPLWNSYSTPFFLFLLYWVVGWNEPIFFRVFWNDFFELKSSVTS